MNKYIKYYYRLIAVDLSRQKEIDAYLKTDCQTKFVWQLKNADGVNADGAQSMLALTILEKQKNKN